MGSSKDAKWQREQDWELVRGMKLGEPVRCYVMKESDDVR